MKKSNKKTSRILENIMDFLISRKVFLVLLIAILYFIFIFLCYSFRTSMGSNLTTLEKLYYCTQCIVGFFTVIGVCMAVLQYIYNSKINQKERNRDKTKEAVAIAEKFSKEIIPMTNKLTRMYSSGISKQMLDQIKKSTLEKFNVCELEKIFCNKQDFIIKAWYKGCYNAYINHPRTPNSIKSLDKLELMDTEIKPVLINLSNQIEAICININSGIADEQTLYQSIHAIFFDIIEKLYIYMVRNNCTECDRLYYNFMRLYVYWKNKYIDISDAEYHVRESINDLTENIMHNFIVENIDE